MKTCLNILRNRLVYQPQWYLLIIKFFLMGKIYFQENIYFISRIDEQVKFLEGEVNELTFIAEFLRQCAYYVQKPEFIFSREILVEGKRISFPLEFNVEHYFDISSNSIEEDEME